MLIKLADVLAIVLNAFSDKTKVVPLTDGVDTAEAAWSTILTRMLCSGKQVLGLTALTHLTTYCLPHAAPLSHIPSPAAANRLLDGNCVASPP